ncbi:tape measure protein [Dyadobacter sp. CY345]|uniref:tape measure protein n=1 Tax=Dyadobacter sp. CY345 TaxID=2909335 RepID=UPI001F23C40E|nr:tape measure protein [Dyadobacter sp. CY345]MCF2443656.1 tape measure protein [Dyadobacter sp. CY345]
MTNVAGANIRLGGDETGLIKSLDNARQRFSLFTKEINSNFIQAYKKADAEQKVFRGGLTRLGDEFVNLGKKMALVGTLPALFAAGKAYKDYADIQRMEKGLALYGSTLDDVRRLAKEPNIGVFDGAKTLIGLRATKIEAGLAERAIKSFANAIAASGGNAADLEPALLNLKQFKSTQNINQVDLRQLSSRIPQAMDIIQKQFGAIDPEKLNKIGIDKFIEGFVSGLEKIPKVAGGAGVAMEQVADSFTFFSGTIGEGIEKAFNTSSKITAIGQLLDNLSTNFRTLNPEAQKAILLFGGMAVVIPPLTVAVGTLIKLWPLLSVGFAGISWPVVAIVATATAISGLIALLPLLNNQTAETADQLDKVASFKDKLGPLMARYEELTAKAKLSGNEQRELKKVTEDIAKAVPGAASSFDKYGNAVDININKVRTFIGEQRKLLEIMQRTQKEAALSSIGSSRSRIAGISRQLGEGITYETSSNGVAVRRPLSENEKEVMRKQITDLQAEIQRSRKELQNAEGIDSIADRRKQRSSIVEELNAIPPAADAAGKSLKSAFDPASKKEYQKILSEEKKDLEDIRDIAASIKAISGSGNSAGMLSNLLGDGSGKFQSSLAGKKSADALKGRAGEISGIANIGGAPAPGTKEAIGDQMSSSLDNLRNKYEDSISATAKLNSELQGAFKETGVNVATGFGEMLGDLASGVGGVETFSQRLLGALGNMLKEMGKALIVAGIGGSALKKLMSVPALAIPAGIAMVAIGQTLTNSMSKSMATASRTKLANGGAIYGPTNAIVGEYPGAANNPELVAPYSKVHDSFKKIAKETMGVGGGNVFIPEMKLRGEDMYIQFKRVEQRNKALGII